MIDSKRDLNCLHFLTFDGIQMKNSKLTHEMCDPSYINNKKILYQVYLECSRNSRDTRQSSV